MNEIFEFSRVLIYLLGALGVIYLGVENKKLSLAFYGVGLQFIVRSLLLILQALSVESYRELNNLISTPSSAIAVILIYINLYQLRRF